MDRLSRLVRVRALAAPRSAKKSRFPAKPGPKEPKANMPMPSQPCASPAFSDRTQATHPRRLIAPFGILKVMRSGSWIPSHSLSRPWLLAGGLAFMTGACGLDPAKSGPVQEQKCIDVPQDLPSLDAATPLGISAQEFLNFSTGPRTDTLHWRNEAFSGELSFDLTPLTGPTTQVTTELLPTGTLPRWVRSTPEFPQSPTADIMECPDRLEIDVQLRIETQDGALKALLPSTLVATSPYGAAVRAGAETAEQAQGPLALANTKPPGITLKGLAYNLSYTPSAHYGELRGVAQVQDKLVPLELGTWPLPAPTPNPALIHDCLTPIEQFYLPMDEAIAGFRVQDVSTQIASANPVVMKPLGGTESAGKVFFDPTQDRLCVSSIQEFPDNDARTRVGVSGILKFQIGDRLTQVPALAVSTVNGQAITETIIRSKWNAQRPLVGALDPKGFRAAYGDFGIQLGAHPFYAIYSEVRYRSIAPGEQKKPLIGGLQVVGITPNPRQPSGAITELIARWQFRG